MFNRLSRTGLFPHLRQIAFRPANALKIVAEKITGLPVLSAGPDAPLLTGAQVHEILAEFP
jgi:hypothetical protein